MMAAASPRFKASDSPDSTVNGPRGVAYCLPIWEISSMRHRGDNLLVGFERAFRHLRHAVVCADARRTATPQLGASFRMLPQAVDGLGQAGGVVGFGFHQNSASG